MIQKTRKKILERCVSNIPCSDCANFLYCMEIRNRKIDLQKFKKGSSEIRRRNGASMEASKTQITIMNTAISKKFRKYAFRMLIFGVAFLFIVGFNNISDKQADVSYEAQKTSAIIEKTEEFDSSTDDLKVSIIRKNLRNETAFAEEESTTELEDGSEEVLEEEESEEENSEEESEDEDPIAVISAYGPSETYYYQVTEEEKEELVKVVWKEARGECLEGKVAVAATVLNRFTSGRSDFDCSSIHSIITQRGAFASIEDVSMSDVNDECYEAVEMALKGYDPTRVMFPNGAYFFFNPDGDLNEETRAEREGIQVYVIGNHWFHTDLN